MNTQAVSSGESGGAAFGASEQNRDIRNVDIARLRDWYSKLHEAGVRIGETVSIFAFLSVPNPDFKDHEELQRLDEAALAEAQETGSLLDYDARPGESTCIWTSDKAAKEATSGPAHIEAMQLAREGGAYLDFHLHRALATLTLEGVEITEVPEPARS